LQQIGRQGRVTTAKSAGGRSAPVYGQSEGSAKPTRRHVGRGQKRQRPRSVTSRLAAILIVAAFGLGLGGLALLPRHGMIGAALAARRDQILAFTGLGLDEIRVSGHRFTDDSAIFEALDLADVHSLPGFDSAKAAARIERLPWIASASITRVFPGRLDISVSERTPAAVWMIAPNQARLIDQSGRVLQAVPVANLPALPRLAGEGAPEASRALFEMLAQVPEISGRVLLATRVTGRRWSLNLSEGVRLELPSEGEAGALSDLIADPQGARLAATPNTVIDLRSRREIAFRIQESPKLGEVLPHGP